MRIFQTRHGVEFNPQKERSKNKKLTNQIILFMCILVIIMVIIAIKCQNLIGNNIKCMSVSETVDSMWIGSLASYWGAIVGGICSGVFAFLGVYYTIKYYKESDMKKERALIQPFLLITINDDITPIMTFEIGKKTDAKRVKQVNIEIKNIGNGFANTDTINTGEIFGGFPYKKVICKNESERLLLKVNQEELQEGVSFYIQYCDSMRNEYIQLYEIKESNGLINIDTGYPNFLKQ